MEGVCARAYPPLRGSRLPRAPEARAIAIHKQVVPRAAHQPARVGRTRKRTQPPARPPGDPGATARAVTVTCGRRGPRIRSRHQAPAQRYPSAPAPGVPARPRVVIRESRSRRRRPPPQISPAACRAGEAAVLHRETSESAAHLGSTSSSKRRKGVSAAAARWAPTAEAAAGRRRRRVLVRSGRGRAPRSLLSGLGAAAGLETSA